MWKTFIYLVMRVSQWKRCWQWECNMKRFSAICPMSVTYASCQDSGSLMWSTHLLAILSENGYRRRSRSATIRSHLKMISWSSWILLLPKLSRDRSISAVSETNFPKNDINDDCEFVQLSRAAVFIFSNLEAREGAQEFRWTLKRHMTMLCTLISSKANLRSEIRATISKLSSSNYQSSTKWLRMARAQLSSSISGLMREKLRSMRTMSPISFAMQKTCQRSLWMHRSEAYGGMTRLATIRYFYKIV